ncbi:hypothetical protein ABPG73_008104 [Tetrahymena malaccensis]
MSALYYFLLFAIIIQKIIAQCVSNQIYDSIRQQCLQCESSCSSCYNTNQNSCTTCSQGLLKSSINNSNCIQKCLKGEFVQNNQQCVQCLIEGCVECDQSLSCLKCSDNLELDQYTYQCVLKKNICQSQVEFLSSPYDQNQCFKSCPSSYYQNYQQNICQKTAQCQQIYNNINSKLNLTVKQVELIQQNQYLVRANKCTFSLADQDWKIIVTQTLQDVNNYDDLYMNNGQEIQEVSFMLGTFAGCLVGKQLVVFDFASLQRVLLQDGLNNQYSIFYIDKTNQNVFFSQNNGTDILCYNKQQNFIGFVYSLPSYPLRMFQITLNSKTVYYIQTNGQNIISAYLQEDRTLLFSNNSTNQPLPQTFQIIFQQSNFLIVKFLNFSEIQVQKITFEDQFEINLQQIKPQDIQFENNMEYSYLLNTFIQYDSQNNNLYLMVLNDSFDQITQNIKITPLKLNSFQIYENEKNNSTIIIWISEQLKFINLTDYLIQINQGRTNLANILIQTINSTYLTSLSTITNVIFKNDFILEIFLSQIISLNTQSYQQLRIQYNTQDQSHSIQYLDPLQYLLNYNDKSKKPNQIIFSKNNPNNSFYILDRNQNVLQQSLGVQKIIYDLQNLQKFSKLTTRFYPLFLNDSFKNYDSINFINSKYLMLRKVVNNKVNEYIIEISRQQQILFYTYDYNNYDNFSKFYYIQKRNLLLVQKIPQVFDLSQGKYFIQNIQDYKFSLENFIIINNDYLAYVTQNNKLENILYLVDLKLGSVEQVFNFGLNQTINFWITNNQYQPLVALNDLIYISISSEDQYQPFSISKKQFEYQLRTLQITPQMCKSIVYQQTGEIFIFYYSSIYIYSYTLQYQMVINTGIQYPFLNTSFLDLVYSEDHVFYYNQNQFYKFDMKSKNIFYINSDSDQYEYRKQQVNFYLLEGSSFIKKSQNIIDTDNMIVIKSQQENNIYLGKWNIDDDLQIDIFQSQKGIYWHINLFNHPFSTLNLTQYQIIQDMIIEQNKIAIFDNGTSQLMIYDASKLIQEIIQIDLYFSFDLSITMLDWDQGNFVWINYDSVNVFNRKQDTSTQLSQLNEQIIEYQVCKDQNIIIVKTINFKIFSVQIQTKTVNQINIIFSKPQSDLRYYLQCDQNLVIVYYPQVKIYNFLTGENKSTFTPDFAFEQLQNNVQCIPLINTNLQLVVYLYDQVKSFFQLGNYSDTQYLFECRFNNTKIYYDVNINILVATTGAAQVIYAINIPGNNNFFTYQTISEFAKDASYYYEEETKIIVIDYTPMIYVINYLLGSFETYNTSFQNAKGILMDKNKKIIIIYSDNFISFFKYPSIQFIESFSVSQQQHKDLIQNLYLNNFQSVLIVLTQQQIIAFDLNEVLYSSETNLLFYQNIQSIALDDNYSVYYSIVNLSLNLYKDQLLVYSLLLEYEIQNIYPYFTQPILIDKNKFIFIQCQYLNVAQVDLINQKINLNQRIKLQSLPDNYFFDQIRNKLFLLYEQNNLLNYVDLSISDLKEVSQINFTQGYASQAIICNDYIIISSDYIMNIFDTLKNMLQQIVLESDSLIKFTFKIQQKQFNDYMDSWWKVPFEFEERYNSNDKNNNNLICAIVNQGLDYQILVINAQSQSIIFKKILLFTKITNAVNDPFRKLIYITTNKGETQIYSFTLNLISTIKNACLKQAIITFDNNFIYSICPNDIIIYNGLSFQQQFPIINSQINEVMNIININYNQIFIITQKNKVSVIQMNNSFQLIKEIQQPQSILQNLNVIYDSNSQVELEILFSTYQNIYHLIIPLSSSQICSVSLKYQNKPSENIFNIIKLNQVILQVVQSSQILSLIQIEYQNNQFIQSLQQQIIVYYPNYALSLVIESSSQQNKIFCSYDSVNFYNIVNLIIRQMSLILVDSIYINTFQYIDILQMYDMTLDIQEQFLISSIKKVFLQNIKLKIDQNNSFSRQQIIILNCNQVLIENIQIENFQGISVAFTLWNTPQIIIKNVLIINSTLSDIFLINNSTSILVQNITIIQSSKIQLFQIAGVKNLTISDFLINQVNNTSIFYVLGSIFSDVQNILIEQSSQIQLFQMKPQQIQEILSFSQDFYLKNLHISQSNDIQSWIQVRNCQFDNFIIDNILVKYGFFTISATILSMRNIKLTNISADIDGVDLVLFLVNDFKNMLAKEINSKNNEVSILTLSSQQESSYFQISSCKFLNSNIEKSISLLQFIDLDTIDIQDIEVKNIQVQNNQYSSIIILKQCNQTYISDSIFKSNTNINGIGGVIYAIDNPNIQITNCTFIENQCLTQSGGALSVSSKINICQLNIFESNFISNNAAYSTGGAINLINSNLIMQDNTIQQNEAIIGGGIYYEQVIPDFILDLQSKNDNNNKINNNQAKFYGNNYGSTLRKIHLDLESVIVPKYCSKSISQQQIFIKQFKSGNYIQFNKIQFLDEEDNPISYQKMQEKQFTSYSTNVQAIIQQISIQVQCDQSISQIQCNGELSSKQFIDDGFKLNVQVMYEPMTNTILQLQSNVFPQLIDSKENIIISQKYLQMNISISFDDCSIGEIQQKQGNSIICEQCPEGKYSLNRNIGPLCYSCDSYGEVWGNKYSQILSPGTCYQCDENFKKILFYNLIIFLFVACYVFTILKKVLYKLQAKLLAFFLNKADILFLGSTIYQSDKPQIISKIMTDHLQIISLICQFQFNLPNFYSIPFQVSGGSMNITSKSLNCFFSNHPEMQPLWFFQSISSFMLPVCIFSIYLTIGLIFYNKKKKNNTIINHLKTTAVFIYLYFFPMVIINLSRSLNCIQIGNNKYLDLDLNVKCLDPQKHQPYIIYFSLPLLILWAIFIPLFLFLKVRKGKQQKWSIFEEIKYSFIFAGYKEKFYYWEFGKLVFKSALIITSILLQQNEFFKSPKTQQSNKFVLLKSHELAQSNLDFKKKNSFKNMRDKWTYYTRQTKQSPLIFENNQDQIQSNKQFFHNFDTQQSDKISISSYRSDNNQNLIELTNKNI